MVEDETVNQEEVTEIDMKEIVKRYANVELLDLVLDQLDLDPDIKKMVKAMRKAKTPEEKKAIRNFFMLKILTKALQQGKKA